MKDKELSKQKDVTEAGDLIILDIESPDDENTPKLSGNEDYGYCTSCDSLVLRRCQDANQCPHCKGSLSRKFVGHLERLAKEKAGSFTLEVVVPDPQEKDDSSNE